MKLPIDASQAEILLSLNTFKIHALNYAMGTITHSNAEHLEPREVKALVDIVLSLEDSIHIEDTEGKQARTIKRLMERYTSDDNGNIVNKNSQFIIESGVKDE
jgi:hypothetical protein